MAQKKVYIGSVGPLLFDDAGTFPDGENHGLACGRIPTADGDVLRKGDVQGGGIVAPENAEYVVVTLDAGLTNERRLQVGTGLSLTDGGAEGDITVGVDEANIDHDTLQNFVANEHIDWTSATATALNCGNAEIDGDLNHDGSNVGLYGTVPVTQAAAMTAQDTSITHTAPGTPDFAIQDLVDSGVGSAFGFATKDEGNTLLQVILNLQVRVAELEAALDATTGIGVLA